MFNYVANDILSAKFNLTETITALKANFSGNFKEFVNEFYQKPELTMQAISDFAIS